MNMAWAIFLTIFTALTITTISNAIPIAHIPTSMGFDHLNGDVDSIDGRPSTGTSISAISSAEAESLPSKCSRSWHYGYVGSYADSDCKGFPLLGDRPKLDGGFNAHCKSFKPVNDTIGIFWGEVSNESREVTFYADDNCQDLSLVGVVKRPLDVNDEALMMNSCIHLHDYIVDIEYPDGVQIGSIKDTGN